MRKNFRNVYIINSESNVLLANVQKKSDATKRKMDKHRMLLSFPYAAPGNEEPIRMKKSSRYGGMVYIHLWYARNPEWIIRYMYKMSPIELFAAASGLAGMWFGFSAIHALIAVTNSSFIQHIKNAKRALCAMKSKHNHKTPPNRSCVSSRANQHVSQFVSQRRHVSHTCTRNISIHHRPTFMINSISN